MTRFIMRRENMAICATYSFESSNINNPVFYYIHHDNYPEEAACNFWKMHKCIVENFMYK